MGSPPSPQLQSEPLVARRVSQACDYCRKKRASNVHHVRRAPVLTKKQLKCSRQRPCMNCQLYGVSCTNLNHLAEPESVAVASSGRKRKQSSAKEGIEAIDQDEEERQPAQHSGNAAQRAQAFRPWDQTSEPEIYSFVQPTSPVPDFDQYALDMGLVLAPFWPPGSPFSLSSNGLHPTADDSVSGIYMHPMHLPTPRLSDPSDSVFQGLDLGRAMHARPFTASASPLEPVDPPSSRSAHELFLRRGAADSKFLGIGSIGSTLSGCLRQSVSADGMSVGSAIIDHLVHSTRHVDELALPTAFESPSLPDRGFAERGVQAYFDFLHLLYPIVDVGFLDEWPQVYDDSHRNLYPVTYSRFCLVVSLGNLTSAASSDCGDIDVAQRLQQETWHLVDRVLASPFIESMQVMLLHTVFLLCCGKSGIAWVTCGMAVRIGQSLGLHQHTPPQLRLSAEQVSLRSRLWAVAYTLDAFLSVSEGRPSAIIGPQSLASSYRLSERECPLAVAQSSAAHITDWHIGLAVIANKVLSLLKNGETWTRTLTQIAEVDSQLLVWKDTLPMDLRPDQQILAEGPLYCLIAVLHLQYHNLMRTIHWISLTLSSEQTSGNLSRLGARVRSSEFVCATAARSVIEVLNGTSSQRIVGVPGGLIVLYCKAAIAVLYRQILKEPTRRSARTDLEYMRNGALHLLPLLEFYGPRRHFRTLVEDMLRVAESAVSDVIDQPAVPNQETISS